MTSKSSVAKEARLSSKSVTVRFAARSFGWGYSRTSNGDSYSMAVEAFCLDPKAFAFAFAFLPFCFCFLSLLSSLSPDSFSSWSSLRKPFAA